MNFEEFITPQTDEEEKEEEVAAPEELDVQKAVVESLAADKVVQDEKIACLTREKEELAKALNAAESRLAEMQKQIEELRKTLEGYGDILAKNTEEKASTQITLLERHEELDERFPGELRDHVIEVIREARDSAEKEGRVRRAQIGNRAEAFSHESRDTGLPDIGDLPEIITGLHVRHMHFYRRDPDRFHRIQDRDRGMGICRRVDDDPVRVRISPLDRIHQIPFMIRLHERDLRIQFIRAFSQDIHKIGIGLPAVDIRFTQSQQIHIRTIND